MRRGSSMMAAEERDGSSSPPRSGGRSEAAAGGASLTDALYRFQVRKVRSWRTSYKRILGLTPHALLTADPSTYGVTNIYTYGAIRSVLVSPTDPLEMSLEVDGTGTLKLRCRWRTELLLCLYKLLGLSRLNPGASYLTDRSVVPLPAQRIKRAGDRLDCLLIDLPFALCMLTRDGVCLREYRWSEIHSFRLASDGTLGIAFHCLGRNRIYLCEGREDLAQRCTMRAKAAGIALKQVQSAPLSTIQDEKLTYHRLGRAPQEGGHPPPAITVYSVEKITQRHPRPVSRRLEVTDRTLVELDMGTGAMISSRTLDTLFALVRCPQEARKFTVEWMDGSSRSYLSSDRDTVIISIIDAAQGVGNGRVLLSTKLTSALRLLPRQVTESQELNVKGSIAKADLYQSVFGSSTVEDWYLRKLGKVDNVISCAEEFNANVEATGISPGADVKIIRAALIALSGKLHQASESGNDESVATLLQALCRILIAPAAFSGFHDMCGERGFNAIVGVLNKEDSGTEVYPITAYWALRALFSLVHSQGASRDAEAEYVNKQVLLGSPQVCTGLADLLRQSSRSVLIVQAASSVLESILVQRKDTTSPEAFERVMSVLGGHHAAILDMLRSPCSAVVRDAILLMQALMASRPDVACAVHEQALSQALLLKHFHSACFNPSADQRFISRHICGVWLGSMGLEGLGLLRRMLPSGMMQYLKLPKLSQPEVGCLDELEAELFLLNIVGATKADARRVSQAPTRLTERVAETVRILRDQAGKEAAEAGGRLNFRVLFHMILQDQSLPDLIWNQETRLELRMGLEAEIQGFQRQQQLHGASQVSWNHMDFRVEYPSLKTQRAVGGMSIHLLLDASESFLLASIEDPRRFAELLFRRILCDWQGDRSFALQCVRALARLYTLRSEAIGPLEDCMVVISFLKRCSDAASQHRLLELISIAVQYHPGNAMLLIEKEVIELMVDLAACAHANPLQVGNALSRDATKTRAERALLIKSGEEDETLFARDDALCPRVWYTAPPAPCPPRPGSERGPFLLGELKNAYATGEIGERTLVASGEVQGDYEVSERVIVVDTGRWRPLIEVEWLRLTVLTTGQPVFTPAEAALLAIGILKQLVNVVPSMGPEGVPLWPVPRAKRLISSDGVLPRLATLLLANDLQVVNAVAELLLDLCHLHHAAAEQLFRTGAFYFACSFTGSNFQTLARLFAATHLRQAHGLSGAAVAAAGELPLHERSVLGSILPTALIMVLENYGCDKFAEVMIGEFDTPEVIWSSTMRKHMVDMLGQHLGDFPYRLRQNPATPYEWCPLPPIQYAHLRNEVYCHNYYIRNICDEMRYPGWPIAEPAEVLRSALEEWRREMRKDDTHAVQGSDARAAGNGIGKGMTVASALECLGITVGVSDKDMRKAYRNLARKYHPDRNPAGRDMFERVHGAYELLSTVDGDFSAAATHPSPNNLRWLMRIQIMLFKSYSPHIKEYKYPGYPLLLDLLRKARSVLAAAPDPQASSISWMEPASAACAIVASCCELTCETCAINALNGEELTREGGLADMLKCLRDVVSSLLDKNALQPYELTVLESTVRVVSSVAQYEAARSALLPHARTLAEDISVILPLEAVRIANEVGDGLPEEKDTVVVMTVQYALQAVCRLCKHQSLQQALADAGTVWYLIPMILSYDPSLEGQGGDHEGQRGKVTQHALNSKAAMAAWCLGCLGGYMADDLACPKNEVVRSALSALLTPQLAQRLRFRRGNELLTTLNSNTEKATCIWLPDMRLQLLSYVNEARKGRGPGRVTAPQELIDAATGISFDALTEEQQVGGVFLRIFNANPDASVSEIESIDGFCRSLLEYLNLAELETDSSTEFKAAVEAFSHLLLHPGKGPLCVDAVCEKGLGSIFGLISREPGSPVFCLAAKILSNMASQRPFAEAVVSQGHLEHLLEIVAGEDLDRACEPARWEIVESLCATVQVAQAILQGGGLLVLLGIISGFEGFTTSLDSRMGAARVLHSLVWHQVLSSQSNTVLGWFFPVTLIELIKADPPAAINTFDSDHETPELIWTQDMREELRTVVSRHLHVYLALPKEEKSSYHLPSHIRVRYAALEQEICIGGVYLRLFLRHPAHDLRQPVQFLQKVMDAWLHECEAQLPSAQSATAVQAGSVQTGTGETALVLGREDLLSLYTSALVFVLKRRAGLADQLVAWGFIVKVADLLERAVGACARGVPMTSCCRILHELASRESTAASIIASSRSFILLLQRALASPLPRDTAFVLGLMKKVIAVRSAPGWEPMVLMGIDHGFIPFIIGNVLESSELGNVHDASAAKVYAIDVIKMLGRDAAIGPLVQSQLASHPEWSKYGSQDHGLFITQEQKVDYFLTASAEAPKLQLLMNGGGQQSGANAGATYTPMGDDDLTSSVLGGEPTTTPADPFGMPAPSPPDPFSAFNVDMPSATLSSDAAAHHSVKVPETCEPMASNPFDSFTAEFPAPLAPSASAFVPFPSTQQALPAQFSGPLMSAVGATLTLTLVRGPRGLGLDIRKENDTLVVQEVFKEATFVGSEKLRSGDVIVSINGVSAASFAHGVDLLKNAAGSINLAVLRQTV